jgi:hypothetical protein
MRTTFFSFLILLVLILAACTFGGSNHIVTRVSQLKGLKENERIDAVALSKDAGQGFEKFINTAFPDQAGEGKPGAVAEKFTPEKIYTQATSLSHSSTTGSSSVVRAEDKGRLHRADFQLGGFSDDAALHRIAKTIAKGKGVRASDVSFMPPYWAVVIYNTNETNFTSIVCPIKLDENAEILEVFDQPIDAVPSPLRAGEGLLIARQFSVSKHVLTWKGPNAPGQPQRGIPLVARNPEDEDFTVSKDKPTLLFFGDEYTDDPNKIMHAQEVERLIQVKNQEAWVKPDKAIKVVIVTTDHPQNAAARQLMETYYKGGGPLQILFDRTGQVAWTRSGEVDAEYIGEQLNRLLEQPGNASQNCVHGLTHEQVLYMKKQSDAQFEYTKRKLDEAREAQGH